MHWLVLRCRLLSNYFLSGASQSSSGLSMLAPFFAVASVLSIMAIVVSLMYSANARQQLSPDAFRVADLSAGEPRVRDGIVEKLRGGALAEAEGRIRPLSKLDRVFVGDLIRTGAKSRMSLRFGVRTRLRLGEKTALRIDHFIANIGGEFDLSRGAIHFDREGPPLNNRAFQIRSRYGLIAVRGTGFFAGPSRGRFGVFVEHGKVDVSSAGVTVTVRPGEGTDIIAPGLPPAEPKKWGADRVREALQTIQ